MCPVYVAYGVYYLIETEEVVLLLCTMVKHIPFIYYAGIEVLYQNRHRCNNA